MKEVVAEVAAPVALDAADAHAAAWAVELAAWTAGKAPALARVRVYARARADGGGILFS